MTKFKTKIVQRFVNGYELHELLLPNGQSVASGSLSHCWDERERWERALEMRDQKKCQKKCKGCKCWVYTETLGSPNVPEWHCCHGFTPSSDCQEMARYNEECTREYYRKHPDKLQLRLNF